MSHYLIDASAEKKLQIGKTNENLATRIDFSGFYNECKSIYGEGYMGLTFVPAGWTDGYPVTLTDGVYWDVLDKDLVLNGTGHVELTYIAGETVKKSLRWTTVVLSSLIESETPPERWEDYVTAVHKSAAEAKEAAAYIENMTVSAEEGNEVKVEKIEGETLELHFTLPAGSSYDDRELRQKIAQLNTNKADRTEIPDISDLATKREVEQKADKSDIPDISGLATKSELEEKADKSEIPDVSGFATKTELSNKADKSEIPDISGLATKQETGDLKSALTDLDDRVTALEEGGGGIKYVRLTVELKGTNGAQNPNESVIVKDSAGAVLQMMPYHGEAVQIAVLPNIAYTITGTEDNVGDTMMYNPVPVSGVYDGDVAVTVEYSVLGIIEHYTDIQKIVQLGFADSFFDIGDQIHVPYTVGATVYDCPFDIVRFGDVELEDGTVKHGMWLQQHFATVESIQFDAAEPNNADANIQKYGYNRYSQSAVRQWLNSDADVGQWWTAQSETDMPPSQLNSVSGYLRRLDKDFQSVLGNVRMNIAANTVNDGGAIDTVYDKIFLPSVEQMYGVPQVAGQEGAYWEYWKNATGYASPNNTAVDGRKIFALNAQTSTQNCWLRSANRGGSNLVWLVLTSGQGSSSTAYNSYRCAPACVIC